MVISIQFVLLSSSGMFWEQGMMFSADYFILRVIGVSYTEKAKSRIPLI